jgi:hypothetical protein
MYQSCTEEEEEEEEEEVVSERDAPTTSREGTCFLRLTTRKQ